MKIELETKFNKGDKFFCAYNMRKKCPYCKRFYPHYEVAEAVVTGVTFNDSWITYRVEVQVSKNAKFSTGYVSEHKLYKTRKEAQASCDFYNKKFMEASINYPNDSQYTELV